jgi:hypothetical protein
MGGIADGRFDNRDSTAKGVRTLRSTAKSVRTLRTRTLQSVLREASAPPIIDFLSLDVEGAETAVLSPSFTWSEYTFLVVIIERPPPDLNARLFAHGYLFVKLLNTGHYTADVCYVHKTHPRAASVAANSSFVQIPAKCRSTHFSYTDRQKIYGVRCQSMFGCCTFPGYPQHKISYLGKPVRASSQPPQNATASRGQASNEGKMSYLVKPVRPSSQPPKNATASHGQASTKKGRLSASSRGQAPPRLASGATEQSASSPSTSMMPAIVTSLWSRLWSRLWSSKE